ncbi:uncharacterized protein LOC129222911 [Uloborus diversus]|uniref:uncharacterized protein LOC129222911 n=1 Tax=Uloborus diversus TaxID=327109 RepID=UPI0024096280|nr:uncharacterized protein LOC129222911 [Uloborus diversus]
MSEYVQLKPQRKSVAVALDKERFSSRSIAKRINSSQSTVVRLLNKLKSTGSTLIKSRSGRPRISNAAQDMYLIQLSLRNRKSSSTDLRTAWENESIVHASTSTVRKRLCGACLMARRPRKKPFLSQKNEETASRLDKSSPKVDCRSMEISCVFGRDQI